MNLREIDKNFLKMFFQHVMNYPIEVKQKGDTILKTIIEGHHRNFATMMLGKTLIPYIEIGRDENNTLTQREISRLYDYEDVFKFRYPAYPKLEQQEFGNGER